MLKILLISIILVAIAFLGLGIRILLDRKAEFPRGACQTNSDDLTENSLACGCGGFCTTDRASSESV